jgi:hypothetical protein
MKKKLRMAMKIKATEVPPGVLVCEDLEDESKAIIECGCCLFSTDSCQGKMHWIKGSRVTKLYKADSKIAICDGHKKEYQVIMKLIECLQGELEGKSFDERKDILKEVLSLPLKKKLKIIEEYKKS